MRISSRNNPIITEASKLLDKKYRDQSGLFLLHGKKLTDEAILTGTRVRRIFAVPELEEYARGASSASGAELIVVEPHVFEKLTDQQRNRRTGRSSSYATGSPIPGTSVRCSARREPFRRVQSYCPADAPISIRRRCREAPWAPDFPAA